ncbi:hypothetical protein APS67_006234 [Streptomyces sp. AVP053U2]|nr:hypothetical protein APS67_006234 [Streptomyces sp. AVP053U2]
MRPARFVAYAQVIARARIASELHGSDAAHDGTALRR